MESNNDTIKKEKRIPRESIVGHTRVIDLLARALDRGRLAHAYLFVGPEQVGKQTVAKMFIASILGDMTTLSCHPDYFIVERSDDPKTGKMRAGIVLDQIRQLRSRLSTSAFMNGWKAAIIDGAHFMNTESANALLKSLEEPHEQTVLILTAPSADAVMPTIRSRCQIMRFARVPTETISEALKKRNVPEREAMQYARLSDGRPGRAIEYSLSPEKWQEIDALRRKLLAIFEASLADRLVLVDALFPGKMSFIESGKTSREALNLFAELLRDMLLISLGNVEEIVHSDLEERMTSLAQHFGIRGIADVLDEVYRAHKRLREHVNPRATMTHVALSLL